MKNNFSTPLAAFNQAQKENDIIYRNYAKMAGLSDTAFWVLYSVAEQEKPYTQKELCTSWFFPTQTVNSALKNLCKRGVIRLESVIGNKKNKLIILTEEGAELTRTVILPLVEAETRAFLRMGKDEYELFLKMTRRHVSLLWEEIGKTSFYAESNA